MDSGAHSGGNSWRRIIGLGSGGEGALRTLCLGAGAGVIGFCGTNGIGF